eukprot:2864368-Rhodomonas_salina.2
MKGNSSGETTPLINAQMRGGLSGRVIGAVLFIVAAVVLTAMRIQNEAIDQQLQFSSTAAKARNNSATTTSLHPSGTKGMAVPHAEGKAGEKGESGGDGGACATIDKAAAYEVTPVNSWTEIAEYQVFTDPRYAAAKSKVASIKAATGRCEAPKCCLKGQGPMPFVCVSVPKVNIQPRTVLDQRCVDFVVNHHPHPFPAYRPASPALR